MTSYTAVDLPQAHAAFAHGVAVPATLMDQLVAEVDWEQPEYNFSGNVVAQPRLSCWMGDPEAVYRFSGRTYVPAPWHPGVAQLRRELENVLQQNFNGCLLNYYRDHNDSISFHGDTEIELGTQPYIATVSLGAERVLEFRNNWRAHPSVRVPLPDRSVFLMWGRTQQCWKHGIRKLKRPCGPRLSLTYRKVLKR